MHQRRLRRLVSLVAVLAMVCAGSLIVAQTARAAQRSGVDTILLVHGLNGGQPNGSGNFDGCGVTGGGKTFAPVVSYLFGGHDISGQSLTWARQDFRGIKYYTNDPNCGGIGNLAPQGGRTLLDGTWCSGECEDLHNWVYKQHCSNYYPENSTSYDDGTNNESLYHLSCLFAWYLHLNFMDSWNVEIVAHSMGGLLVRNTIYQVQQRKAPWTMPATLPHISDVVTFATPHGGANLAPGLCGNCRQGNDITVNGMFMQEMQNSAQNPQASGGTDWTTMGSNCDSWFGAATANYMNGSRKSAYATPCYDHGGYLTDSNPNYDAYYKWCDGCSKDTPLTSWNDYRTAPHSLHHMMYALWSSTW